MPGWYYKHLDSEFGPVSSQSIRKLAREGVVSVDTQLRKEDSSTWVAAGRFKSLFSLAANEDVAASASNVTVMPITHGEIVTVAESNPIDASAASPKDESDGSAYASLAYALECNSEVTVSFIMRSGLTGLLASGVWGWWFSAPGIFWLSGYALGITGAALMHFAEFKERDLPTNQELVMLWSSILIIMSFVPIVTFAIALPAAAFVICMSVAAVRRSRGNRNVILTCVTLSLISLACLFY
jgi:hypothetical protein